MENNAAQIKRIFEILGVKPNEIFQLKGYPESKFQISPDLILYVDINGWSRSSFSIADILNGDKPIIKLVSENKCPYCSQIPVFTNGIYDHVKSFKPFVSSSYETAEIGATEDGHIAMCVVGDDRSDNELLNFCPECGRKLK